MKSDKLSMRLLIYMCSIVLFVFLIYETVTKKPIDETLSHRITNASAHVHNINWGGCGYMALYIKQYCDSAGIDAQIIQIDEPFSHFMVRVDDTYIDANGFFNKLYPPILIHECFVIDEDELQFLLDDPSNWNKDFNRSDTTLLKQYLLCPNLPNL